MKWSYDFRSIGLGTIFHRKSTHLFPGYRAFYLYKLWFVSTWNLATAPKIRSESPCWWHWKLTSTAALIFLISQTIVLKELEQVINLNQQQEIALTSLISKSSAYIIKWIRVFYALLVQMNRMNVFECPSENDTEKKISHRYENIKQALPLEKKRRQEILSSFKWMTILSWAFNGSKILSEIRTRRQSELG